MQRSPAVNTPKPNSAEVKIQEEKISDNSTDLTQTAKPLDEQLTIVTNFGMQQVDISNENKGSWAFIIEPPKGLVVTLCEEPLIQERAQELGNDYPLRENLQKLYQEKLDTKSNYVEALLELTSDIKKAEKSSVLTSLMRNAKSTLFLSGATCKEQITISNKLISAILKYANDPQTKLIMDNEFTNKEYAILKDESIYKKYKLNNLFARPELKPRDRTSAIMVFGD